MIAARREGNDEKEGEEENMGKTVKLADIAQQLGVSVVTVSKALSGQKGVSEALRDKITQLAEELGYQPPAGRKQAEESGYNIGVLIHEKYLDKYDSFYLQMYQGVTAKALSKGCFSLMEMVNETMEKRLEMPRMIREQKASGVIIIGRLSERYLDFLGANCGLPLIYMDFTDPRRNEDSVISDSYYGAYCLTNYLFKRGHRRIAYVGTVLATGSITDRYLGYQKALLERGERIREDWVIPDRHLEDGRIDEERLLGLPEDMPTAFFCNCDLTASMLIRKLQEKGYRVPEDISVAGYDNYLFPGLCNVEITTYEVDMKEMARRAVNKLIKKMKGESYRPGLCIVEGHLVEKDSVRSI